MPVMKIKFWGCRGSIPVPDSRMMKYGGNTTCVEVDVDGKTFIIDAGTGIRKLGDELIEKKVQSMDMFVTHSHWDHIQGFPFFSPIYLPNTAITIYGCTSSYKRLRTIFENQMSYEYFPISFFDLKSRIDFVEICGRKFEVNGCSVSIIEANHPVYTIGLRIEKDGKSFVFITDNEIRFEKPKTQRDEFVRFCAGADYLVHDAQYSDDEYRNRKGWGHSTYEDVMSLAGEARVKSLGFFHHDPNRKDDELDRIEEKFKKMCGKSGCGFSIFVVRELLEIEL